MNGQTRNSSGIALSNSALLCLGLAAAPLTLLASLFVGAYDLSWREVACGLAPWPCSADLGPPELARFVVLQFRLPRTLLAFGEGVALALAGTVLQALWRNPLADANLLGISSAAALGAASMLMGGSAVLRQLLPLPDYLAMASGAVVCAASTLGVLYRLSSTRSRLNLATLLLLGIAVNAICSGLLGFLVFVSTDSQLRALTFWTLGSVSGASWSLVASLWATLAVAVPVLLHVRRALDAILLGERNAFYLGSDPDRTKRIALISAAAVIAVAVAGAGPIAFVGLIVPHTLRLILGAGHSVLLPAAALAGGVFVVLCDMFARWLVQPAELPLGLVTAAIGGPALLVLLSGIGSSRSLE